MIKKTKLANGLTVITQHVESDNSVMLNYHVKVGSNNEKGFPAGIAHYIEHSLFNGTENYDRNGLVETLDQFGGVYNASTNFELTNYYTVMPYDSWKIGTEILTEMLFKHTFPESEIEKEKKIVIDEIKVINDSSSSYAYWEMMKEIMNDIPERQGIIGTKESVSSITREQMVKFSDKYYVTNNMCFVATGNIDHEKLVELLEKIVPNKQNHDIEGIAKYQEKEFNQKVIELTKDVEQSHVRFALITNDTSEKEKIVLEVIGSILGGGMTSRLFKKIREEKGLAYSVGSYFNDYSDFDMLTGALGTDAKNLEEAKSIILEEIERFKTEEVEEKELKKVQNSLSGKFLVQNDSKAVKNAVLAEQFLFNKGYDPKVYAEKIKSVTSKEILEVANKYLNLEKLLFVEVKPK